MKIAVVGAGISGLLAARLLATRHDTHLIEASNYLGGHANTVDIAVDSCSFSVDTGFMVFNDRTYPHFQRLLKLLKIPTQSSDMSFSVSCEKTDWEYQGSSIAGLFAQRRNLFRFKFWGMLADILKFNRKAKDFMASGDLTSTLADFLENGHYGEAFCNQYLLPMTAAIWSSPTEEVRYFPAHFLFRFMHNHGLLQIHNRPRWQTIPGGSRRYLNALASGLGHRIRLNSPVRKVTREADRVFLDFGGSKTESFDAVVMATHADTTLDLLVDHDERESDLLMALPYQQNRAVLHIDENWLPKRRAAWASWNYHIPASDLHQNCVTYDLTRLQRINSPQRILLTLNPYRPIAKPKVLREFSYSHPLFTIEGITSQQRWGEISGRRRTYFCGAYWRNGFHEDGVTSALAVAEQFGIGLEACTAACIGVSSRTSATVQ